MKCLLCVNLGPSDGREPIVHEDPDNDAKIVKCERCGSYRVSTELLEDFPKGFGEDVSLALSGLARAANDEQKPFRLTPETFKKLAESAPVPRSYSAYVDRLLLHFADLCRYPGRPAMPKLAEVAARVYLPKNACSGLLVQLKQEGLINLGGSNFAVELTSKGWGRVDDLQRRRPLSHRAFVAMWFSDELRPAFVDGIKPALLECGYEPPFRVDDPEHEGEADEPDFQPKIDDRIIAEIRRARFVVADVSGARMAVYYEAGFAQGLGIPVIWTCRESTAERDMCFDTRQIGHILWKDPPQLRERLRDRIRARDWDRARS